MIRISVPDIGKREIEAVVKVLTSGMVVQGPKVKELEELFAKTAGTKYAVAVNSGTAALHTALHSIGIKPGDEIITTPFTFVATANSILMAGAKPVFVDIEENSFNIDPKLIERKITKKTKAILVVDLYGQPANYNEINKIAKKHKLLVIEDAAQSIGATYHGKPAGSLADIACFSLYATKNIISGEGGMITTNNKLFAENAKLFRHHGQDEKVRYEYFGLGYNYRMTDIAAAIALQQLRKIKILTGKRQEIAKKYNLAFRNIKGIITPKVSTGMSSVFHQYTLRITPQFKFNRDKFKDYLQEKGIQTAIFYPKGLYNFEHLKGNNRPKNFPVTETVSREVLSIPVHPKLTGQEIKYIIDTICKI